MYLLGRWKGFMVISEAALGSEIARKEWTAQRSSILGSPLIQISLIYTELINPHSPWPVLLSQPPQGSIAILRN